MPLGSLLGVTLAPFLAIFCVFDVKIGDRIAYLFFLEVLGWKSHLSGGAVCGINIVNIEVFERLHFFHKS